MSKSRIMSAVVLGLMVVGVQVPAARADFTFGPRVDLGPNVNSPQSDGHPIISPNGLELYFCSTRPGGYGDYDIWISKRASVDDPWGPAVNMGPGVNSAAFECPENISSDGLTLYLYSAVTAGSGDEYTATRPAPDAPWGPRVKMAPSLSGYGRPVISPDDLELYLDYSGGSPYDIYVSTRLTRHDPWGLPVNLGPTVNTAANDLPLWISPDGRILFLLSDRSGGIGGADTWMARRPHKGAAWGAPVNLGPSFNTSGDDCLFSLSADGRWAYISGFTRASIDDTSWMAPLLPVVDFNSDGVVDAADVCIMIDHWGENYSLCDIGPMPWGDGVVDVKDLVVLAEHLFEEPYDPSLIAHYKLDETEGFIAADSGGENDGRLSGEPLWQPEGGQVGGALQFDGVDDCVITPFILNPADGPFSVLAWIKGGIPSQVVLSQIDSADWLCADPSEGRLMTSLVPPAGRIVPPPLVSELVITDGNWHRIGFVWDGSHRKLYVDGVVAAEDTQPPLAVSVDGLYIGCGKAMEAGTFWLGLIDEVRIYNRAVRP